MAFTIAPDLATALRRDVVIADIASASVADNQSSSIPALDDESPVLGLIDLDFIERQYAALEVAFSRHAAEKSVLHAVACKAIPLRPILRIYAQLGAGCEVASAGELELAIAAGFAPEKIVFDSPAKTITQLHRALELGVVMNVDNLAELARIDALLNTESTLAETVRLGVRINPQTGAGAISALSTAVESAKFGIGLADAGAREAIIDAFLARPWLTQLHVHSGSQGVSLSLAADGIREVVELALQINEITERAGRGKQITRIDIGGGLPVNFAGEDSVPSFADYRAVLEDQVPELFDFEIVTEFGRSLAAKAGTVLTRVEYAKPMGPRRIAVTHAGVQVATRTAYAPEDWPLRILAYDAEGKPRVPSALIAHDVAGPACFSGDLLATDRMLPELNPGDLIAVPDTGAYHFSSPYSYNLLPRIPVVGYRSGESVASEDDITFEYFMVHRGETVQGVVANAGPARLESYRG
ncbi:diaminopimelate decarboxylase [Microbacterium sp.]|uniref:diaminopimelate decarboxylase n=1 Tax=Microbacterium sp. TaxID=51671 RepID=UPI003F971AF5